MSIVFMIFINHAEQYYSIQFLSSFTIWLFFNYYQWFIHSFIQFYFTDGKMHSISSNYLIYSKQFAPQDIHCHPILAHRQSNTLHFTVYYDWKIEMYVATTNGLQTILDHPLNEEYTDAAPCYSFVFRLLFLFHIFSLSNRRIARKWYKLKTKKNKRRRWAEHREERENDRKWQSGYCRRRPMARWARDCVWSLINRFQKSGNNFEICEFHNCY